MIILISTDSLFEVNKFAEYRMHGEIEKLDDS